MGHQVHRFTSVDDFLERAGDFLRSRELEHNLILGVAGQIRALPELFADDPPRFAIVTDAGGTVVAASLRTPPMNQILSEIDEPGAAEALAEALSDEPLPGITGPEEATARFAERWTALTGRRASLEVAERIFRLDRVIPPERPANGSWRYAEPRDRELIARWLVDFNDEALPGQPPVADPQAAADRWIERRYRTIYLWEDGGEVVSLVGAGGATEHGVRIGPVYTPPERRGRGYASSLTAAATQDQLDAGRTFVTLFTDLANPTSNHIYQAIGYRPVRDVNMLRFEADA